ncbi:type II secretion system F family protein [Moritella sp. 24]|uniref:type II secretion system F family protein n=1 Tax=Moritella sp. 24 TaxID=2746230 RepID=UPI001BA9EF36|nr:type II secretion system F family protein [Moritella sp. 24]QUM77021.1 type II secretion system F family protein [Moritella sp. 24]
MSLSLWIAVTLLISGAVMALIFNGPAQRRELLLKRLALVSATQTGELSNSSRYKSNLWLRLTVAPDIAALLVKAGFHDPRAGAIFMLCKITLMLISAMAWQWYIDFDLDKFEIAKTLVFAISGGLLAEHWLKWRARTVNYRIALALPDALDLMVICVESGLTLEAVFQRVGHEMATITPELSREWLITEAELRLLNSRVTALDNLAQRTGLVEVENMVIALSQAEKYGSKIAPTIRLIASDSRQYQYLRLEEKVGKIPAKMSLPVVVLIMLPVVVLIVAPTVIALLDSLGGL